MVSSKDCLFCKIVSGEIPAKKVYEDTSCIAFLDINPRNPGHTLVIPKTHAETIFDLPDTEGAKMFASLKKVAIKVKKGTKAHGVSVCQNNGSAAGQVVGHVHFHVIPRFLNEGPAAMEAILPVKKMDDQTLDKIASAIGGSSLAVKATEPKPEPPQEVEEKPRPPLKTKKAEKSNPNPDEEEDVDEFEEFNFNL